MSSCHTAFHKGLYLYFPKQLVLLRYRMKLSKEEMAQKLAVELPQYRSYETGRKRPTLEFLRRIAKVTGVEHSLLLLEPK